MIIVSQDKKEIINFENIISIHIGNPLEDNVGEFEIIAETDGMDTEIGYYKTEERAKEVLSEIYKKYSDFELIKNVRGEYQRQAIIRDNSRYFDVYQMPED